MARNIIHSGRKQKIRYNLSSYFLTMFSFQYVPIMAEAIILFAADNLWAERVTRKTKCIVHGILIFTGTVVLTVGIGIEIKWRKTHFQSFHSITGRLYLYAQFYAFDVI